MGNYKFCNLYYKVSYTSKNIHENLKRKPCTLTIQKNIGLVWFLIIWRSERASWEKKNYINILKKLDKKLHVFSVRCLYRRGCPVAWSKSSSNTQLSSSYFHLIFYLSLWRKPKCTSLFSAKILSDAIIFRI